MHQVAIVIIRHIQEPYPKNNLTSGVIRSFSGIQEDKYMTRGSTIVSEQSRKDQYMFEENIETLYVYKLRKDKSEAEGQIRAAENEMQLSKQRADNARMDLYKIEQVLSAIAITPAVPPLQKFICTNLKGIPDVGKSNPIKMVFDEHEYKTDSWIMMLAHVVDHLQNYQPKDLFEDWCKQIKSKVQKNPINNGKDLYYANHFIRIDNSIRALHSIVNAAQLANSNLQISWQWNKRSDSNQSKNAELFGIVTVKNRIFDYQGPLKDKP